MNILQALSLVLTLGAQSLRVDVAAPSVGQFHASCVFFAHVPKTGGTTMRNVLKTLSHSRSQKLEVCYNNAECDAPVNKELATDPYIAADFVHDKCRKNQIVYGHGIDPGFADHQGISKEGAVWIAMIREPMTWAVSLYKQMQGSGAYKGSFEQWVRDGRTKENYANYFIGHHDSTESVEKRARDWMESPNVLTLFTENYDAGIHDLAMFLRASSAEESAMRKSGIKKNVRPNSKYNVHLSEASLELLKKDLTSSYAIYDIALDINNKISNSKFLKEGKEGPFIRRLSKDTDIMQIQINVNWQDGED